MLRTKRCMLGLGSGFWPSSSPSLACTLDPSGLSPACVASGPGPHASSVPTAPHLPRRLLTSQCPPNPNSTTLNLAPMEGSIQHKARLAALLAGSSSSYHMLGLPCRDPMGPLQVRNRDRTASPPPSSTRLPAAHISLACTPAPLPLKITLFVCKISGLQGIGCRQCSCYGLCRASVPSVPSGAPHLGWYSEEAQLGLLEGCEEGPAGSEGPAGIHCSGAYGNGVHSWCTGTFITTCAL